MRALVYHGPGSKAWEDVPDPVLQADTDAIVRVDAVTICGTDLHILKGDVPAVTDGRILGHEAVGTVTEIGTAVKNISVGDKVLVSCITACGSCRYCREGSYGQCLGGGGWILGHTTDGTQAEYVRVPFADTSTYLAPAGVSDEKLLMLADILPTGYEVGVLNGQVKPTYFFSDALNVFASLYVESTPNWVIWQHDNLVGTFREKAVQLDAGVNWTIGDKQELRVKLQALGLDAPLKQAYRAALDGTPIQTGTFPITISATDSETGVFVSNTEAKSSVFSCPGSSCPSTCSRSGTG